MISFAPPMSRLVSHATCTQGTETPPLVLESSKNAYIFTMTN